MEKTKAQKLAEEYLNKEKEVWDALKKLPQWGNECDCGTKDGVVKTPILIVLRDEDIEEYPEMHDYCTTCGGYF